MRYKLLTGEKLSHDEALDVLLSAYHDSVETRALLEKPGIIPCKCQILKVEHNTIFLDIDGVLNNSNTKDYIGRIPGIESEKILLLKDLVDYTGSDIVLTSSWKTYWDKALIKDGIHNWLGSSKKRFGRYLNIRLAEYGLEIKDKTEEKHWSLRAEGIKNYITNQSNIIILDDEWFDWGSLTKFWVDTSNEGLTPSLVEEIKRDFNVGRFARPSGEK